MIFDLINTAWVSTIHEQQGKLFIPIDHLRHIQDWAPTAEIALTMFHHPYNWIEANNAGAFRTILESNSDIILTGHEHEANQYLKDYGGGYKNEYIEGGFCKRVIAQMSVHLI